MPKDAIDDIHAMLKKGGFLVTALRSSLWVNGEECGYKDKVDELISDGKFELYRTKKFMRGTSDGTGLFALMESTLVVLKKIWDADPLSTAEPGMASLLKMEKSLKVYTTIWSSKYLLYVSHCY